MSKKVKKMRSLIIFGIWKKINGVKENVLNKIHKVSKKSSTSATQNCPRGVDKMVKNTCTLWSRGWNIVLSRRVMMDLLGQLVTGQILSGKKRCKVVPHPLILMSAQQKCCLAFHQKNKMKDLFPHQTWTSAALQPFPRRRCDSPSHICLWQFVAFQLHGCLPLNTMNIVHCSPHSLKEEAEGEKGGVSW